MDLYKKPTDRNQYLLTSSCHPSQTTKSVSFSLAFRIVRIFIEVEDREKIFGEIKEFLSQREYKKGMVDTAISKARAEPRL